MFIKFIIPAYNAEKTLPKMLDSILSQTFQDFKVIVVDDVSTDGTWNVVQDYQQKHPDKIIGIKSKEKTFAGGARNLGIAYPLESTYTWFVDADDWLNGNDVLQIVYDRYLETNADVFGIDCNKWKYQEWAAPWWRILKSELVCEFQPNLRTRDDVGNYELIKEKIKDKKLVHIQTKPLYWYSGSHNTEPWKNYRKEIQEWLLQKMKNSFITKIIFQFWTDRNEMSDARKTALETSKNLNIKTMLINPNNLNNYIVDGHPLHPAFQYLSAVHKSDYLRCYFMHFHGGGYADIKHYTAQNNWKECFEYIDSHAECLGIGQAEHKGGSPIREYNNEPYLSHLIANGYFIFRPNTEFTRQWLERVEAILTSKYEQLKMHPGINPRQQGGGYPLAWAEICGCVLHQLEIEFKEVPGAIVVNLESGRTYTEWK